MVVCVHQLSVECTWEATHVCAVILLCACYSALPSTHNSPGVKLSFEYYYLRKRMINMPSLLEELSTQLKHELTSHEFADYMETFPTLKRQHADFLALFCPQLEPFYSGAGEVERVEWVE